MKKIILVLSLVLISWVISVSEPSTVQPQMQTAQWAQEWWMPRHEQKLILKDKMNVVDLVFLGDSITHAWDSIGQQDWQQYYAKRNALNIGFSGDRTEHVLWRLQNGEVAGIDPKLVVLMIGTNNTGHNEDKPKDTALGIKRILELLESKLPKAQVLLLAIFPRGSTVNDPFRKINDAINVIIKDFDDGKRVHYLDINHVFLDENGNLSQSVMEDLLHPNQDQYKIWAEAMEPQIRALMGEGD